MFQRRHYEKLAEALGRGIAHGNTLKAVEFTLAEDNEDFNRERFRKAVQISMDDTNRRMARRDVENLKAGKVLS